MDWKEFFKPNKKKIIVFAILAILAFSSVYFIDDKLSEGEGCRLQCCAFKSIRIPFFPVQAKLNGCVAWDREYIAIYDDGTLAIGGRNTLYHVIEGPQYYVIIPLSIIYWYLLSCIILFGYNKYKKTSKKVEV